MDSLPDRLLQWVVEKVFPWVGLLMIAIVAALIVLMVFCGVTGRLKDNPDPPEVFSFEGHRYLVVRTSNGIAVCPVTEDKIVEKNHVARNNDGSNQ